MRKSNIEFEYFPINNDEHLYLLESQGSKNITISKIYEQIAERTSEWNGQYDIDYDGMTSIFCYIDFVNNKPKIEFVEGFSIHGTASSYELDYESDKAIIDWIINKVTENEDFVSFCRRIDSVNKLEEKLSLESTGEESKLEFLKYIKGKIEPLGKIMLNEDDELVTDEKEEHSDYDVIMEGRIRNYGVCKILDNSINGGNSLLFVTEENNILDIPMIDVTIYTARLEFDRIDPTYAQLVLKFWDECQMDHLIEEQTEENEEDMEME